MIDIYIGKDFNNNDIRIDFDKEGIKFVLLTGHTGSGKSIFHNNLYKELSENYTSDEIGFVFLDMTRVDFYGWDSDYIIKPIIWKPEEAIKKLNEIANSNIDKKIFIHIEECDMAYHDREGVEKAFNKIKEKDNIYIIFSTSRPAPEYLDYWLKNYIDLKVVFGVASEEDSEFLLGNDSAYQFANSFNRILAFNQKQIWCQPFSEKETKELRVFKLKNKV